MTVHWSMALIVALGLLACDNDKKPTGPQPGPAGAGKASASLAAPPEPTNLRVETVTDSSGTVRWDAAEGATDYDVNYKPAQGGRWTNWLHPGTGLFNTITGLKPKTAYRWAVRAQNSDGYSDWVFGRFTTLDDDAESDKVSDAPAEPTEPAPEPNLRVEVVVAEPETASASDPVTIYVTVRNNGDEASDPQTITVYRHSASTDNPRVGGTEVFSEATGPLSAGAAVSRQAQNVPTGVESGTILYYYACVSPATGDTQTDENCDYGVVRVKTTGGPLAESLEGPLAAGEIRLLTTLSSNLWNSSWSPDGQHLIFKAWHDADEGISSTYVMDADGSNRRRLSISGVWSPDGQHIAFSEWSDHDSDIYVIEADGSNKRNLTDTNEQYESFPSWSPDGQHIAFVDFDVSGFDITASFIYVMDADGSNRRLLGSYSGLEIAELSWSPNGQHIAFVETIRSEDHSVQSSIYVMDADGSNLSNLSSFEDENSYSNISWSPDGRHIAFESVGVSSGIYVMDADFSNIRHLIDVGLSTMPWAGGLAFVSDPAWLPDGRHISFLVEVYIEDDDRRELSLYVVEVREE